MYALTIKGSGVAGKVIAVNAQLLPAPMRKFKMLSAAFLDGVAATKSFRNVFIF